MKNFLTRVKRMIDFDKITADYIQIINAELDKSYRADDLMSDTLMNAMHYSLSNGGKRIRPILMLEFCKMCGGKIEDAVKAAAALESIHTSSLIHDDLPCMDNDDLRRGKPSCHKAYGEDMALLAGDALILNAFSKITETIGVSPELVLRVVSEISLASGFSGMCGGQLLDLENETTHPDAEKLKLTYKLKTGKLISVACKCGAILAGANEEIIKLAESYGYDLGLAFQIVDDILDVEGDEALLGKPIGSDDEQNKITFVSLYGIENAKKKAAEITERALKTLSEFSDNEYLTILTKKMLIRQN